MEAILSICLGVGLAAACGFRVFIPLLVMSIAAHSGHLNLAPGFQWIGSDAALVAFGIATCLEVAGYYVPFMDNLLDTLATPAAIVAGTVVTASVITGMSPMLKWTLAVIAGGGAAGLVQGATIFTRGASTATTGGLGNPLFATIEWGGSAAASAAAIFVPALVIAVLALVMFVLVWRSRDDRKTLRADDSVSDLDTFKPKMAGMGVYPPK